MIPDFPHDIRIRLALLIFFVASWRCSVSALLAVSAKLRQPTGQRQSNVRTQQQNFFIGPILFEESLVSSNLNSKLFGFHCAHPNLISFSWATEFLTLGYKNVIKLKSIKNIVNTTCSQSFSIYETTNFEKYFADFWCK